MRSVTDLPEILMPASGVYDRWTDSDYAFASNVTAQGMPEIPEMLFHRTWPLPIPYSRVGNGNRE